MLGGCSKFCKPNDEAEDGTEVKIVNQDSNDKDTFDE